MKLVTHTFLTLDGVMQGPGGAEEDPSGGFGRGGWLVPFSDADMGVIVESWFARTEAILLGRNTYETMRVYWSQVTDPANGAATKLNHGRKYVVSNTLTDPTWENTSVITGDVAAELTKLKADTRLGTTGSATLVRWLLEQGLVDELHLLVHPIVVGHGKKLFADGATVPLKLVSSTTFDTGVLYLVYARADNAVAVDNVGADDTGTAADS